MFYIEIVRSRASSKIWNYHQLKISYIKLSPVCYYMEEELPVSELQQDLFDANIEEFMVLYKSYNHNHFKYEQSKVIFYINSIHTSKFPLLVQQEFFTHFAEGRYYCRRKSLTTVKDYLVKEHYPNVTTFKKAVVYIENHLEERFTEGRELVSFALLKPN